MIKKYILAGITACLGFIGFSNANWFGHGVVGNYSQYQNSDYSLMIARYREFNTDFLGTVKRVFAINADSMFYWNIDGYLHGTDMRGFDGKILNYYVCDYVNGDFSQFTNCTKYNYSEGNISIINNMLSKIKVGDRFFYGQQLTTNTNLVFHAVNISDLNKMVVFAFGGCRVSSSYNCNVDQWTNGYMGLDINYNNDLTWLADSKWSIGIENPNTEQGYNFGTIPNNLIGVSPVFQTPEDETPSNGGNSSNNYFCPTIGQLMKNMGANYNTGLCYNGGLKYENGQITTVEKKDIFTVFTDYTEYVNRIGIYRNNCNSTSTQANCQSAFNGNREKYSIIANAINSNVDEKKLWNYCNMGLNYDPNTTTCVASGYITEKPTIEEITNEIINGDNTTILTPGTGTIFDNMNAGEGTGTTYEDVATRDVFGNITQIYDKITRIFEGRSGVNGIIPDYILWMIFVILFFTVLMKK